MENHNLIFIKLLTYKTVFKKIQHTYFIFILFSNVLKYFVVAASQTFGLLEPAWFGVELNLLLLQLVCNCNHKEY